MKFDLTGSVNIDERHMNYLMLDFPDQNRDSQGRFVGWNSRVPRIMDLMEPTVKSGSGDA